MALLGMILAISFLIIVHEAGHFVVARWCGMRVERFSLGFGPAIAKWRSKKGTLFQLAPIPFGGFVEIKGMNIAEEVEPDDREAYPNRPVWQRIATIFAGPFTNYLAAVVLAIVVYTSYGGRQSYYAVDSTDAAYDAHGKLQAGDRLLAIDGKPLRFQTGTELSEATNAIGDRAAVFTIERGGQRLDVAVATKYDADPKIQRYRIGVRTAIVDQRTPMGFGAAVGAAVSFPWRQTKATLHLIVGKFRGKNDLQVGGVVEMGTQVKAAIESGFVYVLELLMMLNVALGLFNLLPLPALDGGRLAFLGYELVTRRRANPRIEATVTMAGVLVLIVLMVFVTYSDIARNF
ncbi:MAG: M50 family metallopeptidase [Kofleriaceae bacterium]